VTQYPLPHSALNSVPSYVPKPPTPRQHGTSYRLFLNENPFPPLPSIVDVIASAALDINRYPEIMPSTLTAKIASRLSVPEADVITGPGSVGIYQQIGQAMLAKDDEVLYAWPSFEAYPIVAAVAGARSIRVPLRDGVHDLRTMAERISPRTRVIFLCDPNNPTGSVIRQPELTDFLTSVPESVMVVLDEAYREFADDTHGIDGVELYRRWPNVVALRTFSKAYGLAGLRVGYGVAHPAIADSLRKCAVPCGVSTIAARAAIASLELEDELFVRVDEVVRERERLRTELLDCGVTVTPSETNFLWLPLGPQAAEVADLLEAQGLMARLFPNEGIRLTVGTPAANDLVVKTLTKRSPIFEHCPQR
jgi:histidinol-phosphate aminotransferase